MDRKLLGCMQRGISCTSEISLDKIDKEGSICFLSVLKAENQTLLVMEGETGAPPRTAQAPSQAILRRSVSRQKVSPGRLF